MRKIKDIVMNLKNSFEKQSKKKKIGIVVSALALVVCLVGGIVLTSYTMNEDDVTVADSSKSKVTVADKVDKKNTDDKTDKKETDKSSDTDKKKADSKTADKADESSKKEESKVSDSSDSKDSSSKVASSSTSSSDSKNNNSSSTGSTSSSSNGSSSSSAGNSNKTWIEPVYEQVYHAEQGHYETRVITPAWTEQVQTGSYVYCPSCGGTFNSVAEWGAHGGRGSCGNYSVEPIYSPVEHPAVTEQVYVVDTPAWTENKLVKEGYWK
ncbi:membrane-associated HD superfamily phosphohydrolase [Lachnospiraceae bacterium PH1-22]